MTSLKLAAVVLAIAATGAAQASFTTYTNQATWSSAAGVTTLEDFNDGDADGFTIGTTGSGHTGFGISGGRLNDRLVFGTPTTTFTFAGGISAFGGNWDLAGPGGAGQGLELFVDGTLVGALPNSLAGGFFGFTSTTSFTTLTVKAGHLSGSAETYALDNVRYAVAAPVPEPETYALMLAGLGVMGFIARRRKAQ